MPLWLITLIVVVLAIVLYSASNTLMKAKESQRLMANERPYRNETTDTSKTILVLGDSTGAGIGATRPEDSVAGQVAEYIGATHVENYARSGAAVEELPVQITQAKQKEYDLILIHIGGNDILSFHDPKKVAPQLGEILKTLPAAKKVVVLCAGNVGGATIFPRLIRIFHTSLTLEYHKLFGEAVAASGGTYVNLYEPRDKDPFLKDPEKYLAKDGLHPSSEGYRLWFEKVKNVL